MSFGLEAVRPVEEGGQSLRQVARVSSWHTDRGCQDTADRYQAHRELGADAIVVLPVPATDGDVESTKAAWALSPPWRPDRRLRHTPE